MSRKVIIFTYYWPPAGGIAVQRFLKFAKYLPQFGWEPIIITVENGSYPYYDESLLKEVSPDLRVYRTKTFEPFEIYNLLRGKRGKAVEQAVVDAKGTKSFFQRMAEYIRANYFIPDARKGWEKYAIAQARKILQAEKIEAIITTGPPHSAHLIGLALKKNYDTKWIADFRDPWTGIFYNKMLPRIERSKLKDLELENSVLHNADCVTVIGEGMKKAFINQCSTVQVIYNGFDEDDFSNSQLQSRSDKFIIRYVGNLMGSQNVQALWNAIRLVNNGIDKGLRVEIIGRVNEEVKQYISTAGLGNIIEYRGFTGHDEALKLMQSAALLVLVIPAVADNRLIITGKLFEYIGSGSEILGIGPIDGDAADVLKQSGRKAICDYQDEEGIQKQIEEAYAHWKSSGKAHKYSSEGNTAFSRRRQTEILVNVLNSII